MKSKSFRIVFSAIIAPSLFAAFFSCGPSNENKPPKQKVFVADSVKNQFAKANKQLVQKENDEMDYYEKTHQMKFVKTPSGVRYFVYTPSAKGDSIRDSSKVSLEYKVSLLNGTECYSSKKDGRKNIVVGFEDIESGIQKALLYFKRGDKALVLIPSHLAHGLLGDFKKIPPQMPIVYDIEIY